MTGKPLHLSDLQLLQLIDGELSSRDLAAAELHLAACAQCGERRKTIARTFDDLQLLQGATANEISHDISHVAGPRALLKARLAEAGMAGVSPSWLRTRWLGPLAYAALLALLVVVGMASAHHWSVAREIASAEPLPDRAITPGATRQVSLTELCAVEGDETIRNVPSQLQSRVFRAYGIESGSTGDFEVDYLITPGLGGSDDVRNLWPEPHSNTLWNSYVKDQLEDHLHRMVCGGKLRLDEAQAEIAGDWITAYKKYFHTQQPLATGQPRSYASSQSDSR